jgi:hypothetical protein
MATISAVSLKYQYFLKVSALTCEDVECWRSVAAAD